MGCGLRNRAFCIRIMHGGLGEEIGTASDISGMEEAVVFEREIGMQIFRAEPAFYGTTIDRSGVFPILGGRESVDHVLDGFRIPCSGVGMVRKHVGGK